MTFSPNEKQEISRLIKPISHEQILKEYKQLREIGVNAKEVSERSRIGNNIVDNFTFTERLETRGKYNINFYEFVANFQEFEKKKFIKNMMIYYETVKNKTGKKNKYVVFKEVYNICISAINIIRPLVYMEIYSKYQPTCVLDFCAGWGGAAVAASVLNIPKYVGIEINNSLKEPYKNLTTFLKEQESTSEIDMRFQCALTVEYSKIDYDFVFTSTPYYFIQKYENNSIYKSKEEMDKKFYIPLFTETFKHLKQGGTYILNVNKEVYDNVCIKCLGPAQEIFPYKKSKRQNNYQEIVYVWKK
jgi:16S rRNA G966 N2-methylase RsmD